METQEILEKSKNTSKQEKKLVQFMKRLIKDENNIKQLMEKINSFERCIFEEMNSCNKEYYKLGFIDGMKLIEETREKNILESITNDSIILNNINEILDYVEGQKHRNLKVNKEYNKIVCKIQQIKNKCPRVREFFEDDKIEQFTKEEMKAILEIIVLRDERAMYEAEEMFKIGLREGKAL